MLVACDDVRCLRMQVIMGVRCTLILS
jgi:hypothetical protein